MGLKPIIHGRFDPCEVPFYCKKCKYFESNGSGFPRCTKREDGKFNPEIGYTCYRNRETGTAAGI